MKEPIREFSGLILGYREDQGNRIVATSFVGTVLGYYDKQRDVTTDFVGTIIARGDVTASLIMNSKGK